MRPLGGRVVSPALSWAPSAHWHACGGYLLLGRACLVGWARLVGPGGGLPRQLVLRVRFSDRVPDKRVAEAANPRAATASRRALPDPWTSARWTAGGDRGDSSCGVHGPASGPVSSPESTVTGFPSFLVGLAWLGLLGWACLVGLAWLALVADRPGSWCSEADAQTRFRISGLPKLRIHARRPRAGVHCPTRGRPRGGQQAASEGFQLWRSWAGLRSRQLSGESGEYCYWISLFIFPAPLSLWTWSSPYWPCGSSGLALLNAGRGGRIRESGNCQPAGDRRADAVDIALEHHPAYGMLRDGK